jgi:hypothetical protein
MTGTNHGMTGAAIALVVREPMVAIPLSFASHFACDALPHFGLPDDQLFTKKFNIILAADFLIAVIMMLILGGMFPSQKWLVWSCMVAAASPDLMQAYYRLYVEHIKKFKVKYDPLFSFHARIQWYQKVPGLAFEVPWFIAMWLIVLAMR